MGPSMGLNGISVRISYLVKFLYSEVNFFHRTRKIHFHQHRGKDYRNAKHSQYQLCKIPYDQSTIECLNADIYVGELWSFDHTVQWLYVLTLDNSV